MITLSARGDTNYVFLRLRKKEDGVLWVMEVGRWWHGHNDVSEFSTTEEVLLNEEDIKVLRNELIRVAQLRRPQEEKLNLTFRANKPRFTLTLCAMQPGVPFYKESLQGMVRLCVGFDSSFSIIPRKESGFDRAHDFEFTVSEEREGGMWWGVKDYFDSDDLAAFCRDLEMNILNSR